MKRSEHLLSIIRGAITEKADLRDRTVFIRNLLFVRSLIVATEKIMHDAMHAVKNDGIRAYLAEHAEEERNHFAWLTKDLADAGVEVSFAPLTTQAAAMAGSQYYLIAHFDPVAVLGYMAVLECFPMPISQVEELERLHGKTLCRTLRYHAEHDIDHGADLLEVIDSLDDASYGRVAANAYQTAQYMNSAIKEFA